jgi:hypothetical protein
MAYLPYPQKDPYRQTFDQDPSYPYYHPYPYPYPFPYHDLFMGPSQMNLDLTFPLLTSTLEIDSYFVVVAFLFVFEQASVVLEVIFVADYIDNFEEFAVFSVVVAVADNHMVVVFAV